MAAPCHLRAAAPTPMSPSRGRGLTLAHALGLEHVAAAAVGAELGPVQLEHPPLRLVVQGDCGEGREVASSAPSPCVPSRRCLSARVHYVSRGPGAHVGHNQGRASRQDFPQSQHSSPAHLRSLDAPVSFPPCPGVLRPPPQRPPPRRHPGEVGWMPRRFSRAKGKQSGRGEPSGTPSPARLPQAPAPTHLAAGVPEGLRVVVAGIHSVGGGVDARELVLVEAQVLSRLLLQDLLGLGLAEGRHLPAGRHCG